MLYDLLDHDRTRTVFSDPACCRNVLTKHFHYAVLGAVSPDYPNLAAGNPLASSWADIMHTVRAGDMLDRGISILMDSDDSSREKQLAWLLGFAAHLVTDMTIHPVVQAKVGVYSENTAMHRICEMHQDSYIYQRMNSGRIGESDKFSSIVAQCSYIDKEVTLDADITVFWEKMLQDVYPEVVRVNPPDIELWHREFIAISTREAPDGVRLFPLAHLISTRTGTSYPDYNNIDRQFIDNLYIPTPADNHLNYDDIWHHATYNIAVIWRSIEAAVLGKSTSPQFKPWDLDTGRDESGQLVFW